MKIIAGIIAFLCVIAMGAAIAAPWAIPSWLLVVVVLIFIACALVVMYGK